MGFLGETKANEVGVSGCDGVKVSEYLDKTAVLLLITPLLLQCWKK